MEHVQQESKLWLKGKWAAMHLLEQSCCQYSVAGCRFHFDDFILYLLTQVIPLAFWAFDFQMSTAERSRECDLYSTTNFRTSLALSE